MSAAVLEDRIAGKKHCCPVAVRGHKHGIGIRQYNSCILRLSSSLTLIAPGLINASLRQPSDKLVFIFHPLTLQARHTVAAKAVAPIHRLKHPLVQRCIRLKIQRDAISISHYEIPCGNARSAGVPSMLTKSGSIQLPGSTLVPLLQTSLRRPWLGMWRLPEVGFDPLI